MRKVEFRTNTYRGLSEPKIGYFHQWGIMSEGGSDGVFTNTVAIVESETGEIDMVYAGNVKFLEPNK